MGCGTSENKKGPVQISMEKYLESKYGKDFIVEKPMKYSNEGFVNGYYYAEAYPKDDKEMKFNIQFDEGNEGGFYDNYSSCIYTKEAEPLIGEQLKSVYGEDLKYCFKFEYYNKEYDSNLNYEDIIKRNPDECKIILYYSVFLDKESFDKKIELEKIRTILKLIAWDKGINCKYVIANYFNKNNKEECINLEPNKVPIKNMYKYGKLINSILLPAPSEDSTVDDLIQYYKF